MSNIITAIEEVQKNSHVLRFNTNKVKSTFRLGLFSDIHFDNPDCDRKLLKKDLEFCRENDIPILLNGDTFCLMQGKYDPRGSKSKVLPEHRVDDYLDAVIRTAVEFFAPYAELIMVVGIGNHEQQIKKRQETDVLKRFVDMLNLVAKPRIPVMLGGYKGALTISRHRTASKNVVKQNAMTYRIAYFHGSGGGGVVTRGQINLSRLMQELEGYDCYTMGHIHEQNVSIVSKNVINAQNMIHQKEVLMALTGTYKDEYKTGKSGWHVERGAPPKPLGGMLLTIDFHEDSHKGKESKTTAICHRFRS